VAKDSIWADGHRTSSSATNLVAAGKKNIAERQCGVQVCRCRDSVADVRAWFTRDAHVEEESAAGATV
jgi:hypothetical protein